MGGDPPASMPMVASFTEIPCQQMVLVLVPGVGLLVVADGHYIRVPSQDFACARAGMWLSRCIAVCRSASATVVSLSKPEPMGGATVNFNLNLKLHR